MENHKLVDKLRNKTNISYEEAKDALEKTNWDILDAMLYLEENGKVQKPSVSIFYTNDHKENYKDIVISNNGHKRNSDNNRRKTNNFGGIFETVCKIIDTCNNIFFEVKRESEVFIRIPITVIILLLVFVFWIVIPLYIVGLFFDIEFSLSGNRKETNKINNILKMISVGVKKVKDSLKKGAKND